MQYSLYTNKEYISNLCPQIGEVNSTEGGESTEGGAFGTRGAEGGHGGSKCKGGGIGGNRSIGRLEKESYQ